MTVDTQDTGFKHQSFTAIRLPLAHSCAQEVRPPAHWSKPIYIRVHQTASIQYTLTLSLREPQNPRDQGWCLVLRATSRRPLLTPCWTCFMSAAASAKHENFVIITSHTARAGRRQTARSTLLMYVYVRGPCLHLGRLKAPRKAAGQMDLLTVPSADGVDSKVIQVEEALSASSRDR